MDEEGPETVASVSLPRTPLAFNPMTPSTSRVATPVRPSSRMSARQYPGSPFRAQPQNMEPSNSRVQELRDAAAGKRTYTNDWMQNNYASPAGQQQYKRPPSMIGSTISNMSNMSEMTAYSYGGLSMLSVNTECGQFDSWIHQSQSHQALSIVSQSSMENQDPMKSRKRMSIPEIIRNLASTEMINQAEAIRELEPIAKAYRLEDTWSPNDLQLIIQALFEVLIPRPKENENVIRKTFEILHHSVLRRSKVIDKIFISLNAELMDPNGRSSFQVPKPFSIYEIVIERCSRLDTKYESSAMLLLVHLCCKPYIMKHVFSDRERSPAHVRLHEIVINFAVRNLRQPETKPKNKGLSVSLIKNLSIKNRVIRSKAVELDIVRIFHEIMQNEVIYEDLLWSTMQALTTFCSDSTNGDYFVRLGGAQVLCGLLSHGSTRLLHELLGCMSKLADLPAIAKQDMKESIHCIVQLIGSSDGTIVERATGTLRNIGLHNKINKAIMVQNGITSHVLAVLRTNVQFTYQPNVTREQILSIYENCLSILNNVTSMSPQDIKESAVHACRMISENPDSAQVLFQYFNIGNRKCRKLAVTVMKRVIETVPAYAELFVDLFGTANEPLPVLLLKRVCESLTDWRTASLGAISCAYSQDSAQGRDIDDRRRDHEDIVKRSLGLLINLCSQANARFYQSLWPVLIGGGINPCEILLHMNDNILEMNDNILQEWLAFILTICSKEESLQNLLLYKYVQHANITQVFFKELHDRRQNSQIREMISRIVNLASQQQALVSQQQRLM